MFRRSGLNSFERPDEPAVCMSCRLGHRATSSRRTSPVAVLSALQRTTSGSIPAAELLEVLSGIGLGNGCVLSNLTL